MLDTMMIAIEEEVMKTSGLRCMIVEKDKDIKAKESNMNISRIEWGREVQEDLGKRGWVSPFLFPLRALFVVAGMRIQK